MPEHARQYTLGDAAFWLVVAWAVVLVGRLAVWVVVQARRRRAAR